VDGAAGFEVSAGFEGAIGRASPSIHHFFTPLINVHTRVFPLNALTCLKPSSLFGQVRPGAACPSGYPSSGFAALVEGIIEIDAAISKSPRIK
jgi:hypothetical protein